MNNNNICVHIPVHFFSQSFVECLQSVSEFDEIIIQDNSNDHLIVEYINSLNDLKFKVFKTDIQDIRKRLNYFKTYSDCEYILWVHTDEVYNSSLVNEIKTVINGNKELSGLLIAHKSYDFGHDFGVWPVPQLRLFKRDEFYFELVSVHEMPKVNGKTILLTNTYHHVANYIFATAIMKNIKYEYINIQNVTDLELSNLSFDNKSRWWKFKTLIKLLFRINYYFIKNIRLFNNMQYGPICMGFLQIIITITKTLIPTDELRMRKNEMPRQTRGYL
ncbi:MAG: hypothetical protein Q8K64_05535 [Sediminibacterium sp.]|nr:hypothetical protein [Sediminibacterium sp.]